MTKVRITVTGRAAIESTLPLFVRRLDGKWVPADDSAVTRARAARMSQHALWIYGVES